VRRLIFLVYALIFTSEALQAAIIPLLPTFAREFAISKAETGALLAATPIAMIVVSVPIGFFADRMGARLFTVDAGVVIAVSEPTAYTLMSACCLGVAAWIYAARRREEAAPA
jgi:MFS family permease